MLPRSWKIGDWQGSEMIEEVGWRCEWIRKISGMTRAIARRGWRRARHAVRSRNSMRRLRSSHVRGINWQALEETETNKHSLFENKTPTSHATFEEIGYMFDLLEHTCSFCFFLCMYVLIIYYFHYTLNSQNELVLHLRVLYLHGINV